MHLFYILYSEYVKEGLFKAFLVLNQFKKIYEFHCKSDILKYCRLLLIAFLLILCHGE